MCHYSEVITKYRGGRIGVGTAEMATEYERHMPACIQDVSGDWKIRPRFIDVLISWDTGAKLKSTYGCLSS